MLIKKYCPILLSMPRNGSTWVQSYIRASYKKTGYGVIPSITNKLKYSAVNEFFGPYDFTQLDTKAKINLIETLEKINLAMCHKVFAHYFSDDPEFFKWFQNFYKDYNIILLRRRNIWKTCISWIFHTTVSHYMGDVSHAWHGKIDDEKNEDKLKSAIQTYKIPFKFDKGLFDYFVSEVRFYQDEVLPAFPNKWQMWLEDLTDEKLAEIFDVELQIQDESIGSFGPLKRIKYSSYYDPKELKLMQDTFEERFENEFQFYGYEYK